MKNTSVILSTYNSEEWLTMVLWSYTNQTYNDFEIIIADDGSGPETKRVIDFFDRTTNLEINHVWHKDNGFQKCAILNKAVQATKTDYIIVSDGDCIARQDFVEAHIRRRKKGYFLSGGYFRLSIEVSHTISRGHILSGQCFDADWLKSKGQKKTFKMNKLTAKGYREWLLNSFTTSKASWNGHNSSGWKDDILRVNGYDERMQYGGEDRELGERMQNFGIRSKQIRYSAICLHLEHQRPYVNSKALATNNEIRNLTKKEKLVWTYYGILK